MAEAAPPKDSNEDGFAVGEHVDYCRDLMCGGCVAVADDECTAVSGVTGHEAASFNRYFPKDHGGLGLLGPDELPGRGYMSVAVHLAEVERIRADRDREWVEALTFEAANMSEYGRIVTRAVSMCVDPMRPEVTLAALRASAGSASGVRTEP